MMPRGIRSILRNTSFLFVNHVVTTVIAAFYAVVIARILGPDLYGTLTYGFSWYLTLIALTYLGLDIVLGREIGRRHGAPAELAGATLILRAFAAALIALVSVAVGLAVEPEPVARQLLLVLSIALFARAIWLWCTSVFTAFERTGYVLQIDLVFRPLEVAVILTMLSILDEKNLVAIAMAHAACWSLQAAVGLAVVVKRVTSIEVRTVLRQAFPLLAAGLPGAFYTLTVVWFLQAPIVLFRQVAGTGDALGQFALATQLLGYLLVVPYLVGSVALPVLSRSAAGDYNKIRSAAIAIMTVIPAGGGVLGVLGLWLAPALISLTFGEGYLTAGRILGVAIWLLVPLSMATNLQQVVFSHGRVTWIPTIAALVGIVAMAGLFRPLTHEMGYHGALLATGLGMTIWAGGLILALIKAGILSTYQTPGDRPAGRR